MPRGGKRPGAGGPKGLGKYGVPTKAIRVPIDMAVEIIQIAKNKNAKLPLYNMTVDAGTPGLVDNEDHELVSTQDNMFEYDPKKHFLVRVSGYSMQDAGILPDDLLLVSRELEAKHGDIIIATVESGMVVKRLNQGSDGNITLVSENAEYSDIKINEGSGFAVQGVVIKVVRDVK